MFEKVYIEGSTGTRGNAKDRSYWLNFSTGIMIMKVGEKHEILHITRIGSPIILPPEGEREGLDFEGVQSYEFKEKKEPKKGPSGTKSSQKKVR